MKVLCFGTDTQSIDQVQLAVRFRWPDASFLQTETADQTARFVEQEGVDLVVALTRGTNASVQRFCSELREFSDVPLIVMGDIASETSLEDVKALEAGADDYIQTTAGLAEIVARVVALIRRAQAQTSPNGTVMQSGDLLVNPATYEVYLGGHRVDLTGTEFNMLYLLMRHKGAVVRHAVIERALWGDNVDATALVKKYVHRLRRKLEEVSEPDHEYIRSVHGTGYLFAGAPQHASAIHAEAAAALLEPERISA